MRREKLEELKCLIEQYKVTSVQTLNEETKFLETKKYRFTLKNGMVINREMLIKNGGNGSASVILPVTSEYEVILTVEPKVFTRRTVGVSVPAGYINDGEYPMHAARRELMEETGYEVGSICDLGSFYQDTGVSGALINYFIGFDAKKTGSPKFDESENVSTFKCRYEEALALIKHGYIEDVNAVVVLERAKKYLRKK